MITNSADLTKRFVQMGNAMVMASRQSALESAKVIAESVDRRLVATVGADRTLSGMTRNSRRKGKKVPPMAILVRPRQMTGARPTVMVKAKGPMHIRDKDIAPHPVVSQWVRPTQMRRNKKGKLVETRRAMTRAKLMVAADAGVELSGGGRRAVLHWGGNVYARRTTASSRGTRMWRSGVNEAAPLLGEIHARHMRSAIASSATGSK